MTLSLTFQEVRNEVICNLPHIPFSRRPISSADILEEVTLNHISSLLEACPITAQWTTRARIYCLLLLIGFKGHEPVCLAFLDDGFDDLLVPFSIATVPLELSSDAETCKRFLELQPIVATRPTLMRFGSSKASAHKNTLHGDLHFVRVKSLGQGGASTIDLVINKHSGLEFARKTIQRGAEEGERRFRAKQFRNEIAALRKVSQNHLVKCVGTYTDQTSYAMILEPVADYNLKALLVPDDKFRVSKSDLAYLPEYFGCLAMAVAFLHANEIRCNDIKPGNILIYHGRLLLCEFGISEDWTPFGRTTTSGAILGATMPYSAPEVRLDGTRNESSDIWSLGRVYVEMLTVLSGRCVEDFDIFISIDNSGSRRKGTSGTSQLDRINDWLEQIRASGDLYELRTVIFKMISREPGHRPTASSAVASIRSASPRFECSVCARSEVPASPVCTPQVQVAEEHDPSEPGAPHHPLIDLQASARLSDTRSDRKLSFQAPASVSPPGSRSLDQRRFSHGRHDSMGSQRSESFDYSAKSEMLTRHDSRQESLLSNPETWERRDDEVLDIETTLLSYSIDQGEPTSKWKESGLGDGNLKLLLYRTECEQPWEVTRRLVMIDPDAETQTTRIFSYWLPLADLTLQIYDDTVVMSWSDCNHDVQEPTRNYVETHSKKYNANKPNNKIVLKVASSATATSNSIALMQALCSPLAYTGQAVRQPDRQIRLMSGERVGIFKVADQGQGDIMMIVGDLAQGATTKIYSIPPHLDLTVAMRTDQAATIQLFQAVVSGLLVTSYASDAQNLSKMMHKKGCFRRATQVNRKAVFTFSENLALFNFLEAVTGWNLMFLARLKSLKEKRTLTHDCGPADMLLWQKGKSGRSGGGGGGDIAITFRLHSDNATEKWISGLVPRDKIIKKIEGVEEASVILQSPSSGDVLERENMCAFSTKSHSHKTSSSTSEKEKGNAKAGAEHVSRFKIVFNNAQDLAEFQSVICEAVVAVIPPTTSTSLAGRSSRGSTST